MSDSILVHARKYYASRRIANEAAKQFLANSIATYGKSI